MIEVIVFFSYTITMMLLMFKSRFMAIGIDQTRQFEEPYLAKMITKIAFAVDFDFYEKKRSYERTKQFYTQKPRTVTVDGFPIRCKFTESDYDSMLEKVSIKAKNIVANGDEERWIRDNLECSITKEQLDS